MTVCRRISLEEDEKKPSYTSDYYGSTYVT
jgi:hypothetical protein